MEHGDFATNWALKAAKLAGMPPWPGCRGRGPLASGGPIQSASVAPPGFINLRLDPAWLAEQVRDPPGRRSLREHRPGRGAATAVEFVSANPTGPITSGAHATRPSATPGAGAGGGRLPGAPRVLHQRRRHPDRQLRGQHPGRYLQALGRDVPFPEQGYQGAYIADYAARAIEAEGDRYLDMPEAEASTALGAWGVDIALAALRGEPGSPGRALRHLVLRAELYADDSFATLLADLDQRGLIVEKDGARWLATSQLGSDRDEVLIRSNGQSGYYASIWPTIMTNLFAAASNASSMSGLWTIRTRPGACPS
ncbi:MAG: hypothetical protein IPL60_15745 [Ardenticatenia bacterium]|nr:hypothetical protein [Ardenticatenia bacterium]